MMPNLSAEMAWLAPVSAWLLLTCGGCCSCCVHGVHTRAHRQQGFTVSDSVVCCRTSHVVKCMWGPTAAAAAAAQTPADEVLIRAQHINCC